MKSKAKTLSVRFYINFGGFAGFLRAVRVSFSKAKCSGKDVPVKESKAKCVCLITRAFSTIQETRIQTAYTSLLETQILLCPKTLLFVF